jgi:deazaflavin-dependent oxidoreductase (nitroreductase family)
MTLPMQFGVQMIFQSFGYPDTVTDGQVIAEEIQLGVLADELGFDALWPVEHHFEDYAFCPDNIEFLAYMAARTERIGLATGAVIMPWHEPVRVAERIALLDHLSGGRTLFGMGRGLARREYAGLGISMDESRDRFDESARMVLDALESGHIEGDGPHYPQARTPIRPRPERSFRDRTYAVAMSPDSVEAAADLGVRMVVFSQKPWAEQGQIYGEYAARFAKAHGRDPGRLTVCDFMYVDHDRHRAEDVAQQHIAGYLTAVLQHYELMSDHFKEAKGYEAYGSAVDLLNAIGLDAMCEVYLGVQAWGTPDDVVDKLRDRRQHLGDYDFNCAFRYAGLPFDDAVRSMRTFAETVIPAMRGDGTRPAVAAAGAAEYEPSPWDFVAEQVEQYESSGGRVGGELEGVPVVILTTVGRRSGKARKSPLMRVTDGERYAVIASKGGAPDHPLWYLNLLAEPEVTLQDGDAVRRYRSRVAEGDERSEWWGKAVDVWPDYAEYPKRTDRKIPLVVLDPVD